MQNMKIMFFFRKNNDYLEYADSAFFLKKFTKYLLAMSMSLKSNPDLNRGIDC